MSYALKAEAAMSIAEEERLVPTQNSWVGFDIHPSGQLQKAEPTLCLRQIVQMVIHKDIAGRMPQVSQARERSTSRTS